MSNAWYHYLGPATISIAFVLVGLASLVSYWLSGRGPDGKKKVVLANALMGAVFGLGVGGTFAIKYFPTSPTPWEREEIYDQVFRTPPERIERFIIKAGTKDHATPLTRTDVVIDDPARIRRIAEILRTAAESEVLANHPSTKWYAVVQTVTLDGTYYFSVLATVPGDTNGTLVSPWGSTQEGWNLGDVRAEGLDEIFQDAVNKAKKTD